MKQTALFPGLLVSALLMAFGLSSCSSAKKEADKEADKLRPNVFFIPVDDLRPELGATTQ